MQSLIFIGKTYTDDVAFADHVREFATANGFGVKRATSSGGKSVYMRCTQCRKYTDKVNPADRVRNGKTTKTAEVECGWMVFASTTKKSGGWKCSYMKPHKMNGFQKITVNNMSEIDLDTVVEHSHKMINNAVNTAKIIASARRLDDQTY